MNKREKIPNKIEREVLFRNEACCCICQKHNIQIHHIDGNHSNNDYRNLAVLCIEHHNDASSKSLMTKGLGPALIRKFKNDWESRVIKKRQIIREKVSENIDEKRFLRFEIKKLIYSLPAVKTKKQTNKIIEKLYPWHLFTECTKDIMDDLGYIRWFLEDDQVILISKRLYEFFWQYTDPKEVPMNKQSERGIKSAIEFLGDLCKQTIILENKIEITKEVFNNFKEFKEISIEYKKQDLINELKNQFSEIKTELSERRKNAKVNEFILNIDKYIKEL